jgi:hypothetical protein
VAALQAAAKQNLAEPGSVHSIAFPGLGANTGRVPVKIVADLMWTAIDLFRDHTFGGIREVRMALENELGAIGPASSKASAKGHAASNHKPMAKATDDGGEDGEEDFDDF